MIAKRPVANAPWRFSERPVGNYAEEYWERLREMQFDPGAYDWQELALRFTIGLPGVGSAIIGTANLDHLRQNIAIAERGPLPDVVVAGLGQAFQPHEQNWVGLV